MNLDPSTNVERSLEPEVNSSKNVWCSLEPEENSTIRPVLLKHLEDTPVGRTPECLVDDVQVSRKQVVLNADYSKEEVTVRRIGRNPSFLDGSCLEKDRLYKAQNSSILELVENGYKYTVKFHKPLLLESSLKEKHLEGTVKVVPAESSYFTPPAKKMKRSEIQQPLPEENSIEWIETGKTILLCKYGPIDQYIQNIQRKNNAFLVAAFDLDGTIIKTKSGNVYPKGPTDWTLWNDKVPSSLRQLYEGGYFIVIISNQASLKYRVNVTPFKSKIEAILKHINVPVVVMISTDEDFFRKPAPGMWFYLSDVVLGGSEYSVDESFFVGDAAGRVAGWKRGKAKDFSNSDRLFANNIQLKFKTPEEFFLLEKEGRYCEAGFLPWDYADTNDLESILRKLKSTNPEVIVMVGLPASGKSTFVKKHILPQGYVWVNRDTLGTSLKCENLLKDSLSSHKKVVIDNTNLDLETRKRIITVCQQYKIVPTCFFMECSYQRCQHNNKFRIIKGSDHAIINPIVMRASLSKLVAPKTEEGFSEIVRVPFIPSFNDNEDRKLYNYHLLVPKEK